MGYDRCLPSPRSQIKVDFGVPWTTDYSPYCRHPLLQLLLEVDLDETHLNRQFRGLNLPVKLLSGANLVPSDNKVQLAKVSRTLNSSDAKLSIPHLRRNQRPWKISSDAPWCVSTNVYVLNTNQGATVRHQFLRSSGGVLTTSGCCSA